MVKFDMGVIGDITCIISSYSYHVRKEVRVYADFSNMAAVSCLMP